MDPKACLERMLHALLAEDYDEAHNAADDLVNWLERGGFAPEISRDHCLAWARETRELSRCAADDETPIDNEDD